MRFSWKKLLVFLIAGLLFGYWLHRGVLLYDSQVTLQHPERLFYVWHNLWDTIKAQWLNISFSQRSALFFMGGLLSFLLAYLYFSTTPRNYRDGEEHGSARFGFLSETKGLRSKLFQNDIIYSQDIRLTLTEKKRPRFDRNKNAVVIGGSGSGKTRFFSIVNLLQAAVSYIVVDPKDHLPEKTGLYFKEKGYQVKVFDLVNLWKSHGFNPFRYVDNENDLNRLLTVYFNNTKGEGTRTDPFWDESSMILVRAVASYLVDFYNPPKTPEEKLQESKLSWWKLRKLKKEEVRKLDDRRRRGRYPSFAEISKLIKLVSKGEKDNKSVLEIMFDNYAKKYGTENFTMRNWADFQNYKDKTLDSVIAVTTAKFALFNIQSVIDLTATDEMELKTWGTQKTIVYVVIPDNDTTYSFLSALFFSTVYNTLTRQADTEFKGRLPIHVRSILDEVANIGSIPNFVELTSTVRSRNMSLVPIFQNIAQPQGLYKEKEGWRTILGNCDSLLYLGGNEKDTWKFISEQLGKQTIHVRNTSRNYGGQQGYGSVSISSITRDLMTPDEVRTMPRDECLVFIANLHPFKNKKFNPEQHPAWKHVAETPDDPRWWEYNMRQPLKNSDPDDDKLDLTGHKIGRLKIA